MKKRTKKFCLFGLSLGATRCAVDDPALKIDPVDVAVGRAYYIACAACHGRDLVSVGAPGPDLRESRLALDGDAFMSAVHGGALIEKGMPNFGIMTPKQVMQIRAYIRQGARDALQAAQAGRAPAAK